MGSFFHNRPTKPLPTVVKQQNHTDEVSPEKNSGPFVMSLLFQCDVIVVAGFGDKKIVVLPNDELFWQEVQKEMRFFATSL